MSIIKRIYRSFMHGPIYILIFGMIFFGIGGGLTIKQFTFMLNGIEVQGEVTGHTLGNCDDDGCTYKSAVSFETLDGKPISYTTTISSSPPAYDAGERVTVFYLPENPQKAVIKGEGKWFRYVFMSVGGAIILFGFSLFVSNLSSASLHEKNVIKVG